MRRDGAHGRRRRRPPVAVERDGREHRRVDPRGDAAGGAARLRGRKGSPEAVVVRGAWAPELRTAAGVLHGGYLMSLADVAAATLAFLNLKPGATTATIEAKTNFLAAVREGSVTARGARPRRPYDDRRAGRRPRRRGQARLPHAPDAGRDRPQRRLDSPRGRARAHARPRSRPTTTRARRADRGRGAGAGRAASRKEIALSQIRQYGTRCCACAPTRSRPSTTSSAR